MLTSLLTLQNVQRGQCAVFWQARAADGPHGGNPAVGGVRSAFACAPATSMLGLWHALGVDAEPLLQPSSTLRMRPNCFLYRCASLPGQDWDPTDLTRFKDDQLHHTTQVRQRWRDPPAKLLHLQLAPRLPEGCSSEDGFLKAAGALVTLSWESCAQQHTEKQHALCSRHCAPPPRCCRGRRSWRHAWRQRWCP